VATKGSKAGLGVFVALLRGVNVGGNNMINMGELRKSFEKLGFAQVATYINSGNVLFKTKENDARKLEVKIEKMLLQEYQLDSKVVVRTLPEMAKLVKSLPASWSEAGEWKYNVMFLRHTIDTEDILVDLPVKSDIEQLVYRPGALLWSVKASDSARTNMNKLPSRKVFREMTVRNLNTTKKLHDLMTKLAESDG
jgi:uncharacterized protein (DUF1697 family)